MAKLAKTLSFKNALIDLNDDSITEFTKDSEIRHSLSESLGVFDGKMVAITIKEESELVEQGEQ
ncbi:YonK family protein [Mammaliicoccus sciuri]|uniref:YonK family protein n=1 Tax=Mammaliicoccus sciuri TaxID=1296 RepID=UPI0021D174EA|nr:YonK family protein [Mammaliicoccus sciuri]UXU70110.1 YonK family protein [Mammaliicoccus sciuri]WQL34230.1 YonK family protein [Mammaliicoccus sciuri]WQL61169.1 YonK family protein [Mammaliicoccus sciuri]